MQISILWWNTSLSPVARPDRATQSDREVVFAMIEAFSKVDVICLGEMSAKDVVAMKSACTLPGYAVFEGFSTTGRSAFDVCVLFRRDKLDLVSSTTITDLDGKSTLKVGQRLDFIMADNDTFMHLFVAHWPSRLYCHEYHLNRHQLGLVLRKEVELALGKDHTGHVVVLGDFNDDPFAESLDGHLKATRDRHLATRRRHLLYNPFWRHMASNVAYGIGAKNPSFSGSYYYKSGKATRWHTFDQIIFSSAFLGSSKWHLKEDEVAVLDVPQYTALVIDHKKIFDHMPVFAAIEKAI